MGTLHRVRLPRGLNKKSLPPAQSAIGSEKSKNGNTQKMGTLRVNSKMGKLKNRKTQKWEHSKIGRVMIMIMIRVNAQKSTHRSMKRTSNLVYILV